MKNKLWLVTTTGPSTLASQIFQEFKFFRSSARLLDVHDRSVTVIGKSPYLTALDLPSVPIIQSSHHLFLSLSYYISFVCNPGRSAVFNLT